MRDNEISRIIRAKFCRAEAGDLRYEHSLQEQNQKGRTHSMYRWRQKKYHSSAHARGGENVLTGLYLAFHKLCSMIDNYKKKTMNSSVRSMH